MEIEGVVVREALSAGVEVLDGCRDAAADQLEATGDQSKSVVGAVLREAGLPLGDAAKDRGGLSKADMQCPKRSTSCTGNGTDQDGRKVPADL